MDYENHLIISFRDHKDASKRVDEFCAILNPGLEQGSHGRSEFSLERFDDHIKIRIKASDSVALRATLNNLTKLFTVYEKACNQ